jgi:hypothetical protein
MRRRATMIDATAPVPFTGAHPSSGKVAIRISLPAVSASQEGGPPASLADLSDTCSRNGGSLPSVEMPSAISLERVMNAGTFRAICESGGRQPRQRYRSHITPSVYFQKSLCAWIQHG